MSYKRSVGFCHNADCDQYIKGVFLLNHGDIFYCQTCRILGKVEPEKGFYTGSSDVFKKVQVEFSFEPITGIYRQTAVVQDESISGQANIYTVQSPLIQTEARALKVAEALLSNLNRFRDLLAGGDIPSTAEAVFSFDDSLPILSEKLAAWLKTFEKPLVSSNVVGG